MSDFDHNRLVALLGDAAQAPPAAVEAVQYHGLASLLKGVPLTTTNIAALSGLPPTDIEQAIQGLIEVGRIELDGDRVVGVGGLTLTNTVHSVTLPTTETHTWCALDAIGIPAALGLAATVTTRCPQCGDRIDVAVHEEGAMAAGPVILFCPTGPCDNVRATSARPRQPLLRRKAHRSVASLEPSNSRRRTRSLGHRRTWTSDVGPLSKQGQQQ